MSNKARILSKLRDKGEAVVLTHESCYHVDRNYRSCQVWTFDVNTRQRTSRDFCTPDVGVSRYERYNQICVCLLRNGVLPPEFKPSNFRRG